MGMESFFITVLSDKMFVDFSESRVFKGYDERFNINWESEFKKTYHVKKVDDFLVLNSLVELHLEKTQQNSIYLSLCGCLSCFDEAINEMVKIIEDVQKIINDKPVIDVVGSMYPYSKAELIAIIKEKYSDKKKEFDLMFRSKKMVCPYQFYKSNSILSILKVIFSGIKSK